ncbi:MAG: hypothetical protein NC397_09265 [Clostridium sp.]|nr:hypothetical protein [Clostridium sp.]
MINLVIGYRNEKHISSADFGEMLAGLYGDGKYILPIGEKLAAEQINSNLIRIHSGAALINGRLVKVEPNTYEDLPIENSIDRITYATIYFRYIKDNETGIETAELCVDNDTTSDGTTEYSNKNILNGDSIVDMPLYLVKIYKGLIAIFSLAEKHIVSADGFDTPGKISSGLPLDVPQYILWQGAQQMDATERADFINGGTIGDPARASEMTNGIVLVFSRYNDGALDQCMRSFFIPKQEIALFNGKGYTFDLYRANFATVGTKYLYIYDDHIAGYADNTASGTTNGVTYNNKSFVLRYVLGV